MKRLATIIACCFALWSFGQSNFVFPVMRDGKWLIVDTNNKVLAATNYTYIHPFDANGYSFAATTEGYVLINASGSQVGTNYYPLLEQMGLGWYTYFKEGNRKIIDASTLISENAPPGELTAIARNWIYYFVDSVPCLKNLVNNLEFSDPWIDYVFSEAGWIMLFDTSNVATLYNEKGEILLKGNLETFYLKGTHYFATDDTLIKVVFNGRGYQFEREKAKVAVAYTRFGMYLTKNGTTTLYDLNGDITAVYPYDSFQLLNEKYVTAQKNDKTFLVDRRSGKILCSSYDDYYPDREGFSVEKGIFSGKIDSNFRVIVPCKYESFELEENELYRTVVNNKLGLYSHKTGKDILPPVYDDISIENHEVIAYRSSTATMFHLDENHIVKDRVVLDNIRQVSSYTGLFQKLDTRLMDLGWFTDTNLVDSKNATFFSVKWGLKSADKILIRPSFGTVQYLDKNYALVYQGVKTFRNHKTHIYQVYGNEDGKSRSEPNVIHVEDEFAQRGYYRLQTLNEYGVIDSAGVFNKYTFVDFDDQPFPRIAAGGEIQLLNTQTNYDNEILGDLGEWAEREVATDGPFPLLFGKIVNARWNFIGIGGKPLFDYSFDYAYPFVSGRAIVKKGGFGVVTKDTFLIPPVYLKIDRLHFNEDRFLVTKSTGKTSYFDENLHKLDFKEIERTNQRLFVTIFQGKRVLMDTSMQVISNEYSTYRFLKNGYVIGRLKNEYAIFSPVGSILYTGNMEPETIYSDEVFSCRDDRKSLLIIFGDTIRSRYIIVQHPGIWEIEYDGKRVIYTTDGKSYSVGKGKVFSDGNSVALFADGTIKFLNGKGKFAGKTKMPEPVTFISGKFVVNGQQPGIFDKQGKQIESFAEFDHLEQLTDGTVLIQLDKKTWYHYDRNWKKIIHSVPHKRIKAIGNGCYFILGMKPCVSNPSLHRFFEVTAIVDTFSSGRLLIQQNNLYYYIDDSLRLLNELGYVQAKPFQRGNGIVKTDFGWNIVARNLSPTSIYSSKEISFAGPGIFMYTSPVIQGLLDQNGKELIPVVFDNVSWNNLGYFQCVLDGQNYYFKADGSDLIKKQSPISADTRD